MHIIDGYEVIWDGPTIWMTVGQGPTLLAVGAGRGCLDVFTLILSQRAVKPKTTNQPIKTLYELKCTHEFEPPGDHRYKN